MRKERITDYKIHSSLHDGLEVEVSYNGSWKSGVVRQYKSKKGKEWFELIPHDGSTSLIISMVFEGEDTNKKIPRDVRSIVDKHTKPDEKTVAEYNEYSDYREYNLHRKIMQSLGSLELRESHCGHCESDGFAKFHIRVPLQFADAWREVYGQPRNGKQDE